MFKRLCLLVLAFHLLSVTRCAASSDTAGTATSRLDAPVHDYRLESSSFFEALISVADQFKIPMGIAWVNTPDARAKLALSWKEATVMEILEGIARTQPGYKVQVRNGVVHVFADVPAGQNFLLLNVESFQAHNEVVQMAERRLRDIVKTTVVSAKPGRGGVAGSLITNVGEPTIDLAVSHTNVEGVLDAIAIASTKKIWVVTFVNNPVLTSTGFRRTLTLWNKERVSDDEQPVWDMFRWNDDIPRVWFASRYLLSSPDELGGSEFIAPGGL